MKFVQTFWTGTANEKVRSTPLMLKAGWLTSEYHWMSWALSCLQLLKLYGKVELVTDKLGKKILIDTLGLPYTSVSLAQEEQVAGMRPELFSLAKLKTYSLQQEPFIHVDGDLFLFQPLSDNVLKAGLVSSNPEADLFFNAEVVNEVHDQGFNLPDHLRGLNRELHLFSSNAGIIGGHDLSFIKDYTRHAFDFISANDSRLGHSTPPDGINFLIEQISFFYLARQQQKQITYVSPEPVTEPLYHDFIRVADIPNVPMVHAVGGCKRFPLMLDHLAKRLRMHYPEYYYRILALCREQKVTLSNSFYLYHDWHIDERSENLIIDEKREELRRGITTEKSSTSGFERTINTLRYALPEARNPGSRDMLQELLLEEPVPDQVNDIFQLEVLIEEAKNILVEEGRGELLHLKDQDHYMKTNDVFNGGLDVETDQTLRLSEDIRLYTAAWNWWKDDDENMQKVLAENFSTAPQELPVAITPEVLTMDAYVYYLDALDAYVVELLKRGFKTIEELLSEVSNAFEEEIDPETNLEYRYLIFDTLKRLAFNRIISFG